MTTTRKTVRAFVSSTFRDMHAERDHLVTVVFPELRERLEWLGLEFFDVDLRWGVPEMNADGEVANSWEYCRQWIERVEPIFICVLGQRYGWIPDVVEFRDPADRARQVVEPRSITDIEVRHAVLDSHRKRRSYFYLRETRVPPLPPDATGGQIAALAEFVDTPEKLQKLEVLKREIGECGRPVRGYSCRWTGDGFADLAAFGSLVLDDLWSGVLRDSRYVSKDVWRRALGVDPDTDPRYFDESRPVPRELWEAIVNAARPRPASPLVAERQQMEAFAESRLRWFHGRSSELEQLLAFVSSSGDRGPRVAVVAAAPGQGKSSLLAKLSTLVPNDRTYMVAHFVGATESSSSTRALVSRLLDELDQSGAVWPADDPTVETGRDDEALRKRLARRLSEYDGEPRIVLLIDALDQLSDGHALQWLPRHCGPGMRIIVSCVNDPAEPAGGPAQGVLASLAESAPDALTVNLGPLTPLDVHPIAASYLKEYCKELDEAHLRVLGAAPGADNPLYLLVALDVMRALGGNEMNRVVPEIIASMPRIYPDTKSLFTWVLQRLEVFGAESVGRWSMYLALARAGLASRELSGLLRQELGSGAAESALLVERGLRRYLQRRGGQIDFYHGQLRRAVIEKYGAHGPAAPTWADTDLHADMATYFTELARGSNNERAWESGSIRGLSECVYHLTLAGKHEIAGSLLSDFAFLFQKIRAGLLESVLEDFEHFHREAPAENVRQLDAHAAFFRRNAHQLRRGNAEWPAYKIFLQTVIEYADDSPLTTGAENWLAAGHCDWTWLRRERRKTHVRVGPCLAVLEGHTKWVEGALVLPDGRILSWSEDETLRIWDSGSGRCDAVLVGHSAGWIGGALVLPDARILSWGKDHTLRIWDGRSGMGLAVLEGHSAWVTGALVLPDGRILSWAKDASLRIWAGGQHDKEPVLLGHSGEVRGALVLQDGRILSWAKDRALRVWGGLSDSCLAVLDDHEEDVTGALCLPDGRILSWAGGYGSQDHVLRIWDARSGECAVGLAGHSREIGGALVLAGDRVLSWSKDATLRVWDGSSGKCVAVLEGHADGVTGALALPDGRILSWSADSTLRIWDDRSGSCLAVLEGHSGWVSGARVLLDGRILSWAGGYESKDQTIRIWNSRSGKTVAVLDGHSEWVNGALALPDGRILSWAVDNALRIWNDQPTAVLDDPEQETREVEGTLLLRDGRVLSWAVDYKARDSYLRIWDSSSGLCTLVLRGHTKGVTGALVLPDERILSWSDDATLRIWDDRSGECVAVLERHTTGIIGAMVLQDGRILSWARDTNLCIWDASGRNIGTCPAEDAALRFPEWPAARAGRQPAQPREPWVWIDRSGQSAANADPSEDHVCWHGESPCTFRHRLSGGIILVTQDNGQVCFLRPYRGNSPVPVELPRAP